MGACANGCCSRNLNPDEEEGNVDTKLCTSKFSSEYLSLHRLRYQLQELSFLREKCRFSLPLAKLWQMDVLQISMAMLDSIAAPELIADEIAL